MTEFLIAIPIVGLIALVAYVLVRLAHGWSSW